MTYQEFLQTKVDISQESGFDISLDEINNNLKDHQKAIVQWAVRGGCRAIFASYGLGKTIIQLEILHIITQHEKGKALIICPLGVRQEFSRDAQRILGYEPPVYVRNMQEIKDCESDIMITNYERVRDGDIDPAYFTVTTLDEASVLRDFGSKTYQTFLPKFKNVKYKFVATATPAPNRKKELIHYAGYLGICDTGSALAQPLSEMVLTPKGYVAMGNLDIGDFVIGRNGKPTRIQGIYPQGEKDIYNVSFSDGSSVRCTADHLWTTQTQYERNNKARYLKKHPTSDCKKYWTEKSTEEISKTLVCESTQSKNHSIPMVEPVEFDSQQVKIDPYLLGYLLGNGHFEKSSTKFTTSDKWIADEIQKKVKPLGLEVWKHTYERKDGNPNYDYSISAREKGYTGRGHKSNNLLNALREYNLNDKRAWEKFVPQEYWFNSADVRLSVLQGLMDSDGTISKGYIGFNTTSPYLAEYVKFCVNSLGGTVHISEYIGRKPNGEVGRKQYRIGIKLNNGIVPFRLPRKVERIETRTKYFPIRYITSVEKCGKEECQCIMVEDEEHLYVTRDFIVTHNTKYFKRDSTKANNLTLYPMREEEFWLWMSSWAVFVSKPSDIDPSYSDAGYVLPELDVRWHELPADYLNAYEKDGQMLLFNEAATGLQQAAQVKRTSLDKRIEEMKRIISENPDDHFLIWHDTDAERDAIRKAIPDVEYITGTMDMDLREKKVIDFSDGKIKLFATKKSLSGSGCNFQHYCHRAIFLGIDYEANNFMQALHRIYRFLQTEKVIIDIIYVEEEKAIKDELLRKWKDHDAMVEKMTDIVKEYGLNDIKRFERLQRKMGVDEVVKIEGKLYTTVNDDCVEETKRMETNSMDMILTSIPFGNHYEYSLNYADMGHNENDDDFFKQMDFLTPELLRVLKPGRIAAIHVKDRVEFGNATGTGFPTIEPFHDYTTLHFMKHGFLYMGMITIITDVVRENNQTYRLGWSEQCKDGTKMGVGCPEYVLLFRKAQSDKSKAYADTPVEKSKEEYTRAKWQIDAHAFYRSSGDRLMTKEELAEVPTDVMQKVYREYSRNTVYNYHEHVELAEKMDKEGRLPATFMCVAPASWDIGEVWDDIVRMKTLNLNQVNSKKEMHVCPLQLDTIERLVDRYTNKGETVYDPFSGIASTGYQAIKMGRKYYGCELSPDYFRDGLGYLQQIEMEVESPTLFDYIGA